MTSQGRRAFRSPKSFIRERADPKGAEGGAAESGRAKPHAAPRSRMQVRTQVWTRPRRPACRSIRGRTINGPAQAKPSPAPSSRRRCARRRSCRGANPSPPHLLRSQHGDIHAQAQLLQIAPLLRGSAFAFSLGAGGARRSASSTVARAVASPRASLARLSRSSSISIVVRLIIGGYYLTAKPPPPTSPEREEARRGLSSS